MNELFSWEMLATFAGASIATAIITQFVKGIFTKIPTQIVSYIIALVVMVLAAVALGTANIWSDYAIIPLNAIIVSLAANGEYSAVKRLTGKE